MRVTRLTFLFCLFISAVGSAQDAPAPRKAEAPHHPIVPVAIGGVDFLGTFDTGMDGAVYMTKATQARLTEQRLLTPVPGRGDILYNIAGVSLTPDVKATISRIRVFNETTPSAAPMGTPEPDIIQFGYAFLRQYKTVWDFSEPKIYLLNP